MYMFNKIDWELCESININFLFIKTKNKIKISRYRCKI